MSEVNLITLTYPDFLETNFYIDYTNKKLGLLRRNSTLSIAAVVLRNQIYYFDQTCFNDGQ